MRRPDDASLLLDMLLAAREARELSQDATFADLLEDRRLQLSVVKLIEIVGEAAGRLTQTFRSAESQVPWLQIIGMRHRLVHGYNEIDYRIVWRVIQQDLPLLIAELEKLVPPQGDADR